MPANELTIEALLRAHAPHAPETLRERVFALEPKGRQRPSLPPRRFALVALPAALGVAVSVAVVHGIVGSGSPKPTVAALQAPQVRTAGRDLAAPPTWRSAGSGGSTPNVQQKSLSAVPAPAVGGSGAARLQHTAASIQLRVANDDALAQATTRATRIATSLGGYAKSVDYRSQGTSVIDLRIPTQNVKTALARLAGLGTIVSQQLSVTDLQQQFEKQSADVAQLRRRIAALRTAIQDPALADAQRVLLRIRLAESQRALSQRLHAQKGTVAAGTTSSISLVIGTKKAIVPVAHSRGRLGRLVHSAVGFLALEAIIALYALIVISPLALLAGLAWLWRRRAVERLLTT
jgi:hypothetical protein